MTSSLRIGQRALFSLALLLMASGQVQGCAGDSRPGSRGPSGGTTSSGFGGAGGRHASGGSGERSAFGGNNASGGTRSGNDASGGALSESDASSGALSGEQASGGATSGIEDAATGVAPDEASPPDGVQQTGFLTWTYHEKTMGMYLPAPTGKSLPVAMYLHACHTDPVDPDFWIISALNAIEPCAVLLPTAPPAIDNTCADWGGTYDQALRPNMVDALAVLDQVIERYGFDTGRQYLYGESMGGEGVFRLLVDFPSRFAGAVSAAGYTLDTGAREMAETPLWILHGSEDGTSPVENDRAIYQSILGAGGTQVKYTEYPGLDHVPGIQRARTEPGLLEWLLAQRRN